MEQRVEFTTSTKFKISEQELRHLYTVLSLLQYPYECEPDYKDHNLIRRLRNDFSRFNSEIAIVRKGDPNNLILSQIQNFIQQHYGCLKRISKKLEEDAIK